MTDDLVKSLYRAANQCVTKDDAIMRLAADRIKADAATIADLRAENEQLRKERDHFKNSWKIQLHRANDMDDKLTAMTANADALAASLRYYMAGAWSNALAHHNQLRKEW